MFKNSKFNKLKDKISDTLSVSSMLMILALWAFANIFVIGSILSKH